MTWSQTRGAGPLTRRMLVDHVRFALLVWAALIVVIGGFFVGSAIFDTTRIAGTGTWHSGSVWHEAAYAVPRWFMLAFGIHIGYSMLPLHIANGQTRRVFAQQAVVYVVCFAAVGAALIALGFVLEAGLYRLGGWPQRLSAGHLFTSPLELPVIFMEYAIRFLVWTASGVFLGAAFYRAAWWRLGAIVLAMATIFLAETALAPPQPWGPGALVYRVPIQTSPEPTSLSTAVPLCAVSALLLVAMTWMVIRDIPLRNKTA